MAISIHQWKELSNEEQYQEWKKWDPSSDKDLEKLMFEILESFRSENPDLTANWGNVHGEFQIIVNVGKPDIPEPYLGIPVRRFPSS